MLAVGDNIWTVHIRESQREIAHCGIAPINLSGMRITKLADRYYKFDSQ